MRNRIMDDLVPISQEPLDVCAVFIKEECLDTPEDSEILVKIERDYIIEDEDYTTSSISKNSSDTFPCEICTKQFLHKRYMIAHRRRHPEYKELAIKLEEEKLRLKQARKEQRYICIYCQKEFSSQSIVNRHMKTHTNASNEKPLKNFICDICRKAFAYKRDLRVHLRVHTGEKPFKCDTCGKRFSQLSSLQYHVKGHLDDKPFPCDLCEKQFIRRISLDHHKKVHSGDRPFKCHLCEKAFTQKRHLVAHHRIHTKYKHRKMGSKSGTHKDSYADSVTT